MPTWETQRTHRFYREADLLFFEIHGEFTLPDIQRVYAESESIVSEYGYVLMGIDAHDSGSMPAEARRFVGDKNREYHMDGASAVIGAPFAIRVLIQLLRNAARLFGNHSSPLLFCATQEEALQWLQTQGRHCRAAHCGPKAAKQG